MADNILGPQPTWAERALLVKCAHMLMRTVAMAGNERVAMEQLLAEVQNPDAKKPVEPEPAVTSQPKK